MPDGRGLQRSRDCGSTSTAITTAVGHTGVHVTDDEPSSATVRCHDANGELYALSITRDPMTRASYDDDTSRATVEAWADTVPALA